MYETGYIPRLCGVDFSGILEQRYTSTTNAGTAAVVVDSN